MRPAVTWMLWLLARAWLGSMLLDQHPGVKCQLQLLIYQCRFPDGAFLHEANGGDVGQGPNSAKPAP